jgi:hypothetical protein
MKLEELKGIVHSDPEIMGGTPVFVGTRVPLQNLVDYLEGASPSRISSMPIKRAFLASFAPRQFSAGSFYPQSAHDRFRARAAHIAHLEERFIRRMCRAGRWAKG